MTNYSKSGIKKLILGICLLVAVPDVQAQVYRRSYPPIIGQPRVYPQRPTVRQTPKTQSSSAAREEPVSTTIAKTGGPQVISKPSIIQAAGSYYLRDNLSASESSTTGTIIIAAPNVTLDLAGFNIRSRGSSDPNSCGILVLADSVHIRNGSVSGFNNDNQCGIIVGAGVQSFVLETLRVKDCDTGILLNPDNDADSPTRSGKISGCSVQGASVGILGFASEGIQIFRCLVTNCAPRREMSGEGSAVLLRGAGYSVEDCSFTGNLHGLRLDAPHSTVSNCRFTTNRNTGLYLSGDACLIKGTVMSANGLIGAVAYGAGCRFEDCTFAGNTSHGLALDTADGASAWHTVVRKCSFTGNRGDGLSDKGAGGTIVENCDAAANGPGGLSLLPTSVYSDCNLSADGGKVSGGIDGGGNQILTGASNKVTP